MKVLWNKNPVYTNTICDELDKLIIAREIVKEKAIFGLIGAQHYLKENDIANALKTITQYLDWLYDDKIDEKVNFYVECLATERHGGDCMCWPCTCYLCRAESMLGFSSIEEFSKHSLYKIESAFATEDTTFAEAFEYLENYNPPMNPKAGWDSEEEYLFHMPRWQKEAKKAAAELRIYKDKHFPEEK
jgi:hypothetical protein